MEILGAILSVIGVISYLETRIKKELKPNGGSSLKDQVNRLEAKVDTLYQILIKRNIEE